jgi:predicted RNase H-related nuclease YkuK (DUF458 family)
MNIDSIVIDKVLINEVMDFVLVLNNNKAIIVGADSNFNKDNYNQVVEVYNLNSLSNEYLESTFDYYKN